VSISRELTLMVFLAAGPAWSQSGSTPPSGNSLGPPTTGSSQPAPDPDTRQSPDQASSRLPAESTKLEPIKIEKAVYPLEARQKQLQGQVVIRVLVSESGDVENIEVVSGDPVLAKSAIAAAKKWKFRPFIKNGKPVAVYTKLPFNFAFAENIQVEAVPPAGAEGPTASDQAPRRVRVSQG